MIYFDNAATTQLAPEVLEAMMPYMMGQYGNPSSFHQAGRAARKAVSRAREQIALALHAPSPACIVFTSGGSESSNWFLHMMDRREKRLGVTSPVEHHATLRRCEEMQKRGWQIRYLPVDPAGEVLLDAAGQIFSAAAGRLSFASVMTANNEIGTLQPIQALSALCHEAGGLFHTDAVQAAGHIPIDVQALDVDFLSMSAHKFHGPKGIGALYIRQPEKGSSLILGGGQEAGLRAGTENVAGIVGMGEALALAVRGMEKVNARLRDMQKTLMRGLAALPGVHITGCGEDNLERRLPNNISVYAEGVTGESLVLALDMQGICAGNGSACAGGSVEPSHVLTAIGLKKEQAYGGLRFSLSQYSTMEEVETVLAALGKILPALRRE